MRYRVRDLFVLMLFVAVAVGFLRLALTTSESRQSLLLLCSCGSAAGAMVAWVMGLCGVGKRPFWGRIRLGIAIGLIVAYLVGVNTPLLPGPPRRPRPNGPFPVVLQRFSALDRGMQLPALPQGEYEVWLEYYKPEGGRLRTPPVVYLTDGATGMRSRLIDGVEATYSAKDRDGVLIGRFRAVDGHRYTIGIERAIAEQLAPHRHKLLVVERPNGDAPSTWQDKMLESE